MADICSKTVRTAFFLLFALVPLLLTPVNYELFEYNKMMAVYALTAVIGSAWIVGMLAEGRFRIPKTPLDIPLGLFALSQLVSTVTSMDPHVSWFGYYSRFNGGMISVLCYIVLYYAFVAHFMQSPAPPTQLPPSPVPALRRHGKKHAAAIPTTLTVPVLPELHLRLPVRLLSATLVAGVLVAAYGVAERLGIDKHLWVQDVQNRVFSTLGQPNWLAAYLVALTPVAMVLGVRAMIGGQRVRSYLWSAVAVLFFVVLLFTRSRSGLVAFAVADVLTWIGMLIGSHAVSRLAKWAVGIHLVLALIVAVNGTNVEAVDRYVTLRGLTARMTRSARQQPAAPAPQQTVGPSLETGGTESGEIRKYVWQAAVQAWKSSVKTMAVGTGTETFAFAFYQHKPVGHNMTSEWDFLYNKAHNEYLNYLATTGIIGLASYMLFLAVFVVWAIRTVLSHHGEHDTARMVVIALFAGWVSVLITNFFGFSVVVTQLILFLFPAIAYVIAEKSDASLVSVPLPEGTEIRYGAMLLAGGSLILLLVRLTASWQADRNFASGYRLDKVGQYAQAYPFLTKAVRDIPDEPMYRDERANALSALSITALSNEQATLAGQLAQEALSENEAAIMISPNNVNFWKTRTKILYALSGLDPGFTESAITALKHAFTLSPNDPKIAYNLAILSARNGDDKATVDYFVQAKTLKPDYHDAYKGLYLFYTEAKQPDKAKAVLTEYLTKVNASDIEFTKLLKEQQ